MTPPVDLRIDGLRAGYRPGRPVVAGVDLSVPAGTLTALLGPSGCGKTTLLKVVAGLLDPAGGDVRVGGRSVLGLPAERRPVGLVFQKPLLFGHLSVGDNVAFGLRMRGVPARARRHRAAEMLDLVGLPDVAARRVGELSGGQEQRVALARALVLDPQVLLLDEPFSQLDADLRTRVRELVRRVQRELSITTLFVTHDQQEAVDVADAIALLLDGRVAAHGPPAVFYSRPPTLAAARFFAGAGGVTELPGTLSGTGFTCALGRLRVAPGGRDGPGVLVVRPEALRLVAGGAAPDGASADGAAPDGNRRAGTVTEVRFRGTHQAVAVALGGATVTLTVAPAVPVHVGEAVTVHLPSDACTVLPDPAAPHPAAPHPAAGPHPAAAPHPVEESSDA